MKNIQIKSFELANFGKNSGEKMWKLNHCSTVIKVLEKSISLVLFEIGMKNFRPCVCKLWQKKTLTVVQHWSKSSQSRSPLANGCFQLWTNIQINNKLEQGRTNTRYIFRNIELFQNVESKVTQRNKNIDLDVKHYQPSGEIINLSSSLERHEQIGR